MTPDAITRLFKEAYDTFPPRKGKPTGDNLLAIRRKLLPLLMVIPYDQLEGTHSLVAILTEASLGPLFLYRNIGRCLLDSSFLWYPRGK